ncbi:signal peptide peptidase SppA [Brevundimonas subvibrioides]|uniref:Signal peptide peptidase SppA, 67K type n=1 Tax=Brevundimonas subvibrioides (strain ATCC 15264 / DSM 4735 / LMG 14903 / NBRC 16000 / CB 81) TaxID=633149 RepID=D9QMU0_BRESC|nr:signal peptide peptidase SppA [Brevundimonas subvibrioides]ADL02096.1 signal peptide peptidase SppA, 67K type [Brevundimonas subvibrioides ATCC 15264]
MKQFFLTVLGVFTGLILFVVVLPIVLIVGAAASAKEPATPANAVLELDLREGLTDQAPTNPFAAFGGSGLSVIQIVDTLAQAEKDSHVKVLLIRLPEAGISPASADEIRQAVRRFRASGKPVIAHSQGFQPVGTVISSYMVGASASELWMQNTASFQATGFSADSIFLGRAFDRYGVRAEFEQRYEYKNAVNEYTQSDYTGPHREAMTAWMTSIYDSAIANAAFDRKVTAAALKTTIEAGPYSAPQALSLKLIDKIGQVEEAEAEAKRRAGNGADILEFGDYASSKGERQGSGRDAIAIVGGEGAIVTGTGGGGAFGGGSSIRSDDTAEAIYDAIEDKSVKAIVFRVSSPGGSPEASEQILAAVRAAKAAGKPVVVSMGDYAASGGYWISSEANWIVAQPSTLTGSIGVFGGKFVVSEALGRFGVDLRGLSIGGDYADAFAPSQSFTTTQRAAFSASMDRTYEEFVQRVSTGRRLPIARVREIARGRVWTGAQGKTLGLVDQLGGLTEAIGKARELANIPADTSVRFKRFPTPQSPWEALSAAFGVQSEAAQALVTLGGVMSDPQTRAVLNRVEMERMRGQGASVLADQPL